MSNPQNMQDLFRLRRVEWLEGARHAARGLLKQRRTITIEDVLEVFPRPKYLHRNTTGHVFKDVMFQPVGYTTAKRLTSHGRVIRLWSLSDAYADRFEEDCD